MIFPILNGWPGLRRAPVTWALILLNVMIFSVTSRVSEPVQDRMEDIMRDPYFLSAQGRAYAQYLKGRTVGHAAFVDQMAARVFEGDAARASTLGQLAFRDTDFMNAAAGADVDFDGDQVAFGIWRKRLARLRADQGAHPSFTLGLNVLDQDSPAPWLTYIFVHGGAAHLFGNMLFLMIFGAALELRIGGLGLLLGFLGGGVVAAFGFAFATGVTSSPLVGASGAISAVMALCCTLDWRRPARYFWMVLPWPGYLGLVYLPSWTALVVWGAADLAGAFGTLPELGGVAYTAHLGGDVAGIAVGLGLAFARRRQPAPSIQPTILELRSF